LQKISSGFAEEDDGLGRFELGEKQALALVTSLAPPVLQEF